MSTLTAAKLATREREEKALSLRIGGATFEQIGAAIGISGPGAYGAYQRALKRHVKLAEKEAEHLRGIELMRLDRVVLLALTIMQDATKAADVRLRAADRLVKAGEVRAKLLGFNAPSVLAAFDLNSLTDEQLSRIAKGENPLTVLGEGGPGVLPLTSEPQETSDAPN